MTARAFTAASPYPSKTPLCASNRMYTREFLLGVKRTTNLQLNSAYAEKLQDAGLLRTPVPPAAAAPASRPQWPRRKRCERKHKRGSRGGIRARLAANPFKQAIPSIILANGCSLDDKLDHVRSLRATQRIARDCCVFVFTGSGLDGGVPDRDMQLEQLTCYRADGGKTRGGGLCVYIHDAWCRDAVVVSGRCSELLEFMILRCRPFYTPGQHAAILLVAVYFPPGTATSATRREALRELHLHATAQQAAHPGAFLILAGDLNHADPTSVFPHLQQHVDLPTCGDNVYTAQSGAYKAVSLPQATVMLMPACSHQD